MKLPKLHIRDLFWLVLVCALGLAWWRAAWDRDDLQLTSDYYRSILYCLVGQPRTEVSYEENVLTIETPQGTCGWHLPDEFWHPRGASN